MTNTMEKGKPINIRISSVEETRVENNCGVIDLARLTEDALVFQFKVSATINVAKETVAVFVSIRYRFENADLFQAGAKVVFEVSSLDEMVSHDKGNNTVTFSYDIIPTLVNASYGTLRGVVYKETKNTPLEKYPIPLMPMKVLVDKCVVAVEE